MALKDYLGVIDNALKHVFDRKAVDPAKARRPLLRGIDRTLAQFKTGSSGTPTGWYRIRNGVVALTVKIAGNTFDISGEATNHLPAERFEDFLGHMRAAVDAGEFDAELANKGDGDAKVEMPKRTATTVPSEAARLRGIKGAATRKANREKVMRLNSIHEAGQGPLRAHFRPIETAADKPKSGRSFRRATVAASNPITAVIIGQRPESRSSMLNRSTE